MIFGVERSALTVMGALVAYAVVAGAYGLAQRSNRLREERVQRWNAVFGGGSVGPTEPAAARQAA